MAYRYDIDGLRALAIVLVVIYHVWVGRVSGGVDVFLMISAYFLTASLAKRAARGEKPRLLQYWALRFRRLMPAAAVTILGVVITAYLVFPPTEWPRVWRESWASLFYYQNWALAFSEVDYYNLAGALPSPLQHFWSLSVQGQVFILFPIVIAIVGVLTFGKRALVRPLLIVVFTAIFAGSLWFSITETMANQTFAYFDTRTRLWEFAAGALIALILPSMRVPRWLAAVLGWLGIIGIVACGMVLDVQGGFPGYLALWPVLCTAAVIIGGSNPAPAGPYRLLSSRPMRFLGKDAYALYLVHWPVLITWRMLSDNAPVTLLDGAIVVAISVVLARIITFFIERPLRKAPPKGLETSRGLIVMAASMTLVAAPLGAWQHAEYERAEALRQALDDSMSQQIPYFSDDYPGAASIFQGIEPPTDVDIRPLPAELEYEWVTLPDWCDGDFQPSEPALYERCSLSAGAAESDGPRIMIIGDSHSQQLSAPLVALASHHDIVLQTIWRGGCTIGLDEPSNAPGEPSCEDWRVMALDFALEQQPDAVYVVASRALVDGEERLLYGVEDFIDPLLDAGITVIAVRDNPRWEGNLIDCVYQSKKRGAECGVPIAGNLAESSPLDELDERVIPIDFTPWICPKSVCEAVIGNIAVYLDDNHTTALFGFSLAPVLERKFIAAGLFL